jgi:hypothetical protein
MKRLGKFAIALALVASLGLVSACQRMVDVQNGTRIVDAQGNTVSEDITVVHVPADKAGAYRVNVITQEATGTTMLAGLYADAQKAIGAGDLKLAQSKLKEIIAIQPSYRLAKKQSDAITAGQKVAPDTTSPAPTPAKPKPTTPPAEAPTALSVWTPDVIAGFSAAKAAIDPLSVSREYAPGSGNPAKSLVIVAEQFRTSADAQAALGVDVKQRYPHNVGSFTVKGHTVYFGTDGKRFAAAGFTSGAVMVAVEASPDSGSPSAMKAALEKVIGQLP